MKAISLRRAILPTAVMVTLVILLALWMRLEQSVSRSVSSAAVENKSVVVLDAGHGGMDGGATVGSIRESDINLAIAKDTRDFLTLMGYRIIMTRDGDYSIHDSSASTIRKQKRSDLENRLQIMRSTPEAVCVSIHQNHFGQSYVHGAQVFYGAAAGSEELAETIQENIAAYLQTDNERKTKQADSSLYILINNDRNPSVMVECGFLSNPGDAANLRDSGYQRGLAYLIGCSLIEYGAAAAAQ